MKILRLSKIVLSLLCSCITLNTYAWQHSIEFGYGFSHDPNHTKYNNSGFLLSGDMFTLLSTPMTHWSITGSLGQWLSSAPVNKNLTSLAASLGLRFYPVKWENNAPYLLASAGPAVLSTQKFGLNTQASHLSIQTNIGLGDEVHQWDFNLRLQHFSNAGLGSPNQGFNILYLASVGYLF